MGLTQSNSSKPVKAQKDKKNKKSAAAASEPEPGLVMRHAVIMHGLENSGKDTVKAALKIPATRVMSIDDRFVTTPSIYGGQNNKNRPYSGMWRGDTLDKTLWRYGGRGGIYPRWTVMAGRTRAIMFVVDSTDRARLAPAADFQPLPQEFVLGYGSKSKTEQQEILATLKSQTTAKSLLHSVLAELSRSNYYFGRNLPLLVLATKQDVEGAMSVDEICEALDLKSIDHRDWQVAGINAVSGEGLQEAVDWLNYIVECPTQFEKQKNYDSLENRIDWFKTELKRVDEEYKQQRLTRGDVLPAPSLFRTNGTIVTVSQEESAKFVVSPLSSGDQDVWVQYDKKLEVLKRYQTSYPDVKDEFVKHLPKPSIGAQIKPDDADEEPSRSSSSNAAVNAPKRRWIRATVLGAAASSSPVAQPPAKSLSSIDEIEEERSRSASNVDSDSSSSSDAEVEVSHHAETVTHTPEPEPELSLADPAVIQEVVMAVQKLKEENLLVKEMPSEKVMNKQKFQSIGSAALVLPPRSEILLAPHTLRKKHWYSRKMTLMEEEDYGTQDIHKVPLMWF